MLRAPIPNTTFKPIMSFVNDDMDDGDDGMAPSDAERVQMVINRHNMLKTYKQPWLNTYQLIGEYVMLRKQNFTVTNRTPGQFMTDQVFDSTAPMACHQMASSMIGALWPNAGKSFRLKAPRSLDRTIAASKNIKEYFRQVTEILCEVFDDPLAGFGLALDEYMLDQCAFGVSGIGVFENTNIDTADTVPIHFIAVDAKKITIDEGKDGFVDTVYIERHRTVRQIVQEYKLESCSDRVKTQYKNSQGMDEYITVLHAIEPYMDGAKHGFGNSDMPIASIHVEVDTGHKLREGGYFELPVFVTRFWKAMGEVYGRSPSFDGMPDIILINTMQEATIVATEKQLDPPLLIKSAGALGGAVIDTSAGSVNVEIVSGRMGEGNGKTVEQLVTVGELTSTYKQIEIIQLRIEKNYFMDQLLDFNNKTRMTLGEASMRDRDRMQGLVTIYGRQIAELFTRVVKRVFNICMKRGMLGVAEGTQAYARAQQSNKPFLTIPQELVDAATAGADFFDIEFISPAARMMRAGELTGLTQWLQMIAAIAPSQPDILDNVDMDELARVSQELTGAPSIILRPADLVAQIRQAKQQAQAQAAAQAAKLQDSEAMRNTGQAAQAAAKAGLPVQSLLQGLMDNNVVGGQGNG